MISACPHNLSQHSSLLQGTGTISKKQEKVLSISGVGFCKVLSNHDNTSYKLNVSSIIHLA